jgi:hypothetical protein
MTLVKIATQVTEMRLARFEIERNRSEVAALLIVSVCCSHSREIVNVVEA